MKRSFPLFAARLFPFRGIPIKSRVLLSPARIDDLGKTFLRYVWQFLLSQTNCLVPLFAATTPDKQGLHYLRAAALRR